MSRTAADFQRQALAVVGPAFSGLSPLFAGFGEAMELVEPQVDNLIRASLLSDATGGWLDLVGDGDGFLRNTGEDDDTYRARIGAPPLGVGPAEIKAAVDAVLAGAGFGVCAVFDRQNATYYAAQESTGSTELSVELFADGNTIMIGLRQVYVVCPEVGDDAVEVAICQAAARVRMAGIDVRILFSDTLTPATGYGWSEA